jgi:hypothetical protein
MAAGVGLMSIQKLRAEQWFPELRHVFDHGHHSALSHASPSLLMSDTRSAVTPRVAELFRCPAGACPEAGSPRAAAARPAAG